MFVERICSCAADRRNITTDVRCPDGIKADEVLRRIPDEALSPMGFVARQIGDSSSEVRFILDRPVMCSDQRSAVLGCDASETVDSVVSRDDVIEANNDSEVLGDAALPAGTEAAHQQLYEGEVYASSVTEGTLHSDDIVGKLLHFARES